MSEPHADAAPVGQFPALRDADDGEPRAGPDPRADEPAGTRADLRSHDERVEDSGDASTLVLDEGQTEA